MTTGAAHYALRDMNTNYMRAGSNLDTWGAGHSLKIAPLPCASANAAYSSAGLCDSTGSDVVTIVNKRA